MRYWTLTDGRLEGPWPARELLELPHVGRDTMICPEPKLGEWVKLGVVPELEASVYFKESAANLLERIREMGERGLQRERNYQDAAQELSNTISVLRRDLERRTAEVEKLSANGAAKSLEWELTESRNRELEGKNSRLEKYAELHRKEVEGELEHLRSLLELRGEDVRRLNLLVETSVHEKGPLESALRDKTLACEAAARQVETHAKREREALLSAEESGRNALKLQEELDHAQAAGRQLEQTVHLLESKARMRDDEAREIAAHLTRRLQEEQLGGEHVAVERQRLERDLAELKVQAQEREKLTRRLEEELGQALDESRKLKARWKLREEELLQEGAAALRRETQRETSLLEEKAHDHKRETQRLESELERSAAILAQARAENAALLERLNDQRAAGEQSRASLQTAHEHAQREIAALLTQAQEHEKESRRLQAELAKSLSHWEEREESLRAENVSLIKSSHGLRSALEKAEQGREAAEAERARLSEAEGALRGEMTGLKASLVQMEAHLERLEASAQAAATEITPPPLAEAVEGRMNRLEDLSRSIRDTLNLLTAERSAAQAAGPGPGAAKVLLWVFWTALVLGLAGYIGMLMGPRANVQAPEPVPLPYRSEPPLPPAPLPEPPLPLREPETKAAPEPVPAESKKPEPEPRDAEVFPGFTPAPPPSPQENAHKGPASS